ncbi:hypothetical protein [Kyrpidia tusciae]|uniref:Uncharacterized protein n=1 Tax=Kyrpidia tusciae (strain DSM 2912 / NBRC 15312 / T2) TaxID=562970 RepID=D5WW07_KYRT2|nr:hypothetical protein [Kyrpidia tusciae]ADG05639.1 conserved hypothetical protein [Kyrpidia tusciae DSM 2912]
MCVLCADLVTSVHWTEGVQKENDSDMAYAGSEDSRLHRRRRLEMVAMLNQILAFYGLTVSDWNGVRFVVSDKKGQMVMAQNLSEVWQETERLSRRLPDPLDETLLRFISQSD